MFFSEIRKIIYTPVNPSFTIETWGLRGSKLYRHVFVIFFSDKMAVANSADRDQNTPDQGVHCLLFHQAKCETQV